ncbi:hypothetical protein NEOLEDRAFT_1129727 [Neolentinus lepideus HHB14362 ss-1]|uniref:MATH domain-containing protein n=1 Tax=Neolentinus lepideus HHB14362 ss-1 TaxID=1314782 RepID=A0A165UL43_9AGAM|nr:hypothetical protein NEOLEDRAFT_1129727 [Neolentinus lepideus HHB14362 ss-1]
MSTNDEAAEYQESTTLKFEWTLRGLKSIFESSKGDLKSKVTRSAKFGGGRWQILFYANSGTSSAGDGGYVSLYLSCEPTQEEKENASNGKWAREGRFRFSFELRNLAKMVMFNAKEAHDHSFSWKTANWGWAQFARRDTVYYLSNAVRSQDAFVIICTITSSPTPPSPPPPSHLTTVPRDLMDSVGGLLNDPLYSDVEFILPRRGKDKEREARKIYASKRLLRRADYFETMFSSGFAEATSEQPTISLTQTDDHAQADGDEAFDDCDPEDSDEDEDEDTLDRDADVELDESKPEKEHPAEPEDVPMASTSGEITSASEDWQDVDQTESERNVRPKLMHPPSPRTCDKQIEGVSTESVPGPSKLSVVVKDVAYNTYLAVLYYIYTDCITFAPLSSSFLSPPDSHQPSSAGQNVSDNTNNANVRSNTFADSQLSLPRPASRKEWIRARKYPGSPTPCSAKAVYRLADKLDLRELKERAFRHIVKSLTVQNIPYEMFSSFSTTFDDIRKVQMQFFLEHWGEIRTSEAMRNVWPQIRAGRHPGFEEVWPLIISNLEYKPPLPESSESQSVAGSN